MLVQNRRHTNIRQPTSTAIRNIIHFIHISLCYKTVHTAETANCCEPWDCKYCTWFFEPSPAFHSLWLVRNWVSSAHLLKQAIQLATPSNRCMNYAIYRLGWWRRADSVDEHSTRSHITHNRTWSGQSTKSARCHWLSLSYSYLHGDS